MSVGVGEGHESTPFRSAVEVLVEVVATVVVVGPRALPEDCWRASIARPLVDRNRGEGRQRFPAADGCVSVATRNCPLVAIGCVAMGNAHGGGGGVVL